MPGWIWANTCTVFAIGRDYPVTASSNLNLIDRVSRIDNVAKALKAFAITLEH